jgi:hypothetical protein
MPSSAPSCYKGPIPYDGWEFDSTDMLLMAIAKDGVLSAEFFWNDPSNREYSGCYRSRDYQIRFNRIDGHYEGFACARSVGKTERQKIQGFTHFFRRVKQNLLITAPELLHLLPLTDAIEGWIDGVRATRECLKRDKAGKTGFGHMPFSVDYADGTKIIGRIPQKDGKGVKGQHQPDLMIEEAQDYPDRGWVEVNETVSKDMGDFTFHFYGVHRGNTGGGFATRSRDGSFRINTLTAIMRKDWNAAQKRAAIATYGGTNNSDYRRNILGEPGSASSPIFVTSRLMACVDQDRESEYNVQVYKAQELRWEDFEQNGLSLAEVIDLPSRKFGKMVAGMDLGLTNSPTVLSIFGEMEYAKKTRMALIRRIHLNRFSSKYIRELVSIVYNWNPGIGGIGMDITGLGFPIFQEIQDDENHPDPELLNAVHGWKFNEKISVGLQPSATIVNGKDPWGRKVDMEKETVQMTVIEATTRYLREWVDTGYVLLPFDLAVTNDLLAENLQRVASVAGLTGSKKPNAFHILDSFRMAALIDAGAGVDEIYVPQAAVLDQVIHIT